MFHNNFMKRISYKLGSFCLLPWLNFPRLDSRIKCLPTDQNIPGSSADSVMEFPSLVENYSMVFR